MTIITVCCMYVHSCNFRCCKRLRLFAVRPLVFAACCWLPFTVLFVVLFVGVDVDAICVQTDNTIRAEFLISFPIFLVFSFFL